MLDNKVVMVTGASSGIGRTAALRFADCGAKVAVVARRQSEGEAVANQINQLGGTGVFIKADVAKEVEVKSAVECIVEKFGRLDLAFNNAGVSEPIGSLTELTEANWNRVMDINLKGIWLSMKYQIPAMLSSTGGGIVNMSSIYGQVATGMGVSAYVSSNHGVIGLTKAAALEYADKNIRVNAVCPAWIPTPGNEEALSNPDVMEYAKSLHPMRRLGTQNEVAETVCWLLSESASYISGQAISVDGAYTAQ
ncbi:glucose 1-dehydrogenase [Hahella ganghwensis]|uniref:glucose 1-dehydrogenase n=1 Tax=Hahella ganghwensis TaxID=286420 RepID=UPI00037D1CA0|nr:glucose 1-dehydrogenase [Hahella ganghwensis]